jgi:hypothetical protein
VVIGLLDNEVAAGLVLINKGVTPRSTRRIKFTFILVDF